MQMLQVVVPVPGPGTVVEAHWPESIGVGLRLRMAASWFPGPDENCSESPVAHSRSSRESWIREGAVVLFTADVLMRAVHGGGGRVLPAEMIRLGDFVID